MKSFIHIGADKCGSSSIQRFFSENSNIKYSKNKTLQYSCLTKKGILTCDQVKSLARKQINGYISSLGLGMIKNLNKREFNEFSLKNDEIKSDMIYSCEGWYRALVDRELFKKLTFFLEGSKKRDLIFIAYVRSPVQWINSAWWQWGAWQKGKLDFEEWLERSTFNVRWYRYFSKLKSFSKKYKLILKPYKNDVLKDILDVLEIDANNYKISDQINQSLPIEVLKYFLENPELRPNSHQNKFDTIFSKRINKAGVKFKKTPWILKKSYVNLILNNTLDSNLKLIELLDYEDKNILLNDPAWWDINYYKDIETHDPNLKDYVLRDDLKIFFKSLLS